MTQCLSQGWDARVRFCFRVLMIGGSAGRYSCVGKQLALMQLRSVIARLAYDFDFAFADGEDGVAFDGDSMDTFTFTLGALNLVFTDRVRE